jgi:hypothetical protein
VPRQFGHRDESLHWSCDKCRHRHRPGTACPPTGIWLDSRRPAAPSGVIWLKRPMPDGQWPPEQWRPRDDTPAWWIRSHCGHEGGARQWAFYEERYADMYEQVFRADPCHWTQCQDRKRRSGA